MRRLARRLGLRAWTANITRYGDSRNPFLPLCWEPDPRGELR